jgi:release factor glutamine methyltransferase
MEMTIKHLAERFYRPWVVRYLSKARTYVYKGVRLEIPSGVFHPGFFFSTKFLLKFLARQPLNNRSFLELGAGSGLISLFVAKHGAYVTATDINPLAVKCLEKNAMLNEIPMNILESDLYARIPEQPFDLIAVNPPYYRKQPATDAERAWYCGPNGEYFDGFFGGLARYVHPGSGIWMVLCEGCDLEMIKAHAARYSWSLECVRVKRNLIEKDYIFRITPLRAGIL